MFEDEDKIYIIKNLSDRNLTGKGIAFELKAEFDEYIDFMSEWYGNNSPSFNCFIKNAENLIKKIEPSESITILSDYEIENIFIDVLDSLEFRSKRYDSFEISVIYQ